MQRRKQCLLLTCAQPRAGHLDLFDGMAEEFGFDLERLDDHRERVDSILDASFLIADVSDNDPSVLYDVGVAHTFGKRVFLVTDKLETLAFDMAGNRTWVIEPASDNREIYRAMERFLGTGQTIGPVRLYLGRHAFFGENLMGRRLGAFLIDALLIASILAIGLLFFSNESVTLGAFIDEIASADSESASGVMTVAIVGFYLLAVYFVVVTWIVGATLGQWLTGIRVVQADTRRVTFGQSVGRTALTLLVIWSYGAAFLAAMVPPGYRAAHDILSGTIVVRRHPR